MDNHESKKLALLRILQILQKHSDCDHPMRQEDVAAVLERDYGIVIERKAIGRNLSLLREAGYEIESTRDGCYLAGRDFTDAELRVLIDGVLSSKYITARYSKDIIEKLCSLSNVYFRSHVRHVKFADDWDRTDNQALFYNIEIIDEAISKRKRITFDYNRYGVDKKLHRTAEHTASPYQLILHNQRYYLMSLNERWKNIAYYRVDRITNMKLTDEKLTPLDTVEGYKNGIDYKTLSTALPYMFTDTPTRIEFTADVGIVDQIIDWFGKDIMLILQDDGSTVKASVKASPKAMEYWAMQYSGAVTVTAPTQLVSNIKARLLDAAKRYKVEL